MMAAAAELVPMSATEANCITTELMELAATNSLPMRPMMMVIIELPMAQIISLKIMGVAARTKAPNITRSNRRRSWRRNWILCSRRNRNQATMRNSTHTGDGSSQCGALDLQTGRAKVAEDEYPVEEGIHHKGGGVDHQRDAHCSHGPQQHNGVVAQGIEGVNPADDSEVPGSRRAMTSASLVKMDMMISGQQRAPREKSSEMQTLIR